MSSPAKAAATVQNDILLVQYSPTGNGIGDLYAIVLSDLKKPLPFQIQRQAPDLQALKGPVVSMTLATVPPSSGANPATPNRSPPAPPGSSPAADAVVPAPPFLDTVLSVNAAGPRTQVWHINAPGRGVPPGATPSNLLAPLWSASIMSPSLFPNATSVSLGAYAPAPRGLKTPGILAVLHTKDRMLQLMKLENPPDSVNVGSSAWKQGWDKPMNLFFAPVDTSVVFHPTALPEAKRGNGVHWTSATGIFDGGMWYESLTADPPVGENASGGGQVGPDLPTVACFTSTPSVLVAIEGTQVIVNEDDALPRWVSANTTSDLKGPKGPVIACTASSSTVVAIVPNPNASQSQPDIHLFDLQSSSWSKAQLVQAPPGTFSDIPPNPPPPGNSGNPGNGGPSEGGSNTPDDPRIKDPSPPNATTSRAALIGGIVGGIVALGVLIFVGFFFSRRRGSKQKGQHQSELDLKSWDGDDGLHKDPRMHDRERSGRGDETSLDANDYQQKATLSESYQHKIASPQAQAKAQPRVNNPQVAYTPTISQHEIALPQAQAKAQPRVNNPQEAYTPTISQYEIALPQAGSPQETPQQQIVNSQENTWSPASNYYKTASSPRDSPRKMSRSRVNNPQEVTRAMVPVVHRVNNPQYDPNQQF